MNARPDPELLWRHLRLRQFGGHKFRRQHPIGKFIVDFVYLEKRVIVEVNGGHHSEQVAYDLERDTWLKKQGSSILRFWDNQVLREIESVKEVIMRELDNHSDTPHLNPPPQGGRRSGVRVKAGLIPQFSKGLCE
jgi:very-short-patch-repair endonuclease